MLQNRLASAYLERPRTAGINSPRNGKVNRGELPAPRASFYETAKIDELARMHKMVKCKRALHSILRA